MMYSKPTECVSQLVYSFWRLEAERFGKRVGWVFVSFFLVETHGEMRGGHLRVESDFTPNLSKAIQKYTRATPMKSNRKNMMIWRLLTFLCGSRKKTSGAFAKTSKREFFFNRQFADDFLTNQSTTKEDFP